MAHRYKHLVVVHGIGDQLRNETSISFMNEFVRSLPDEVRDLEVHNIVEHIPIGANRAARPAYMTCTIAGEPHVIAFSEVYWQPVPNDYLRANGNPPVPVFVWAHSINTRLLQGGPKYQRAREAIDNLEAMLRDLRGLAGIYHKAGVLTDVLVKFLCDVQMYVESQDLREAINGHFLSVLESVGAMRQGILLELRARNHRADLEGQDIYVVAHSEGTVVAYNSLVQAASEREGNPNKHGWLSSVRTLVTLGSPLDKHYGIWRNRFRTDVLTKSPGLEKKIAWRNYWDRSDPVGYGLNKLFEPPATDAARLFEVTHDRAFTRYPIPGKAHIDYWTDDEIHHDVFHEIAGSTGHVSRVVDKWWWFLQVPGDYFGYLAGRVLTALLFVFFLSRVLTPLEQLISFDAACGLPGIECAHSITWHIAFWALTLPLALNGLFEMDRDWNVGHLRSIHTRLWDAHVKRPSVVAWARKLATAAWLGIGALATLAYAAQDPAPIEIKDWIGYVIGLIAAVLVWRVQTRLHTGLLQLWRYTGGHHTSYGALSPPDVTSEPPAARTAQLTVPAE